jgi:hypothetical protein
MRNITEMVRRVTDDGFGGDIKTYKAYEMAVLKAEALAQDAVRAFGGGTPGDENYGPDFIITTTANGRFTPVFLLTSWMNAYKLGGYLGFFAQKGYFSV